MPSGEGGSRSSDRYPSQLHEEVENGGGSMGSPSWSGDGADTTFQRRYPSRNVAPDFGDSSHPLSDRNSKASSLGSRIKLFARSSTRRKVLLIFGILGLSVFTVSIISSNKRQASMVTRHDDGGNAEGAALNSDYGADSRSLWGWSGLRSYTEPQGTPESCPAPSAASLDPIDPESGIVLAARRQTLIIDKTDGEDSEEEDKLQSQPLPYSSVLAHAAGFTVFQNAYYDTSLRKWYFNVPVGASWTFPDFKWVMTEGDGLWDDWNMECIDRQIKERANRVAKIFEGRKEAAENMGLSGDGENGSWRSSGRIQIIEGNTLFFNDPVYLDHFYHVIGEMFVGMWRIWQHYIHVATRALAGTNETIDSHIDRVVFAHVTYETVADHAGMNMFTLGTWFKDAEFLFGKDWDELENTGKILLFERVVVSDRITAHRSPRCKGKPFDDVVRLDAPSDWMTQLRDRLIADYEGDLTPPERPLIFYLSRQSAGQRTLAPEIHDDLVRELKKMEEEGIADVVVEDFTDKTPKADQVAKISRASFLVSMHGNGLTHLLWMNPTPLTGVMEIQKKDMYMRDYLALSEAMGWPHWIAQGDSLCTGDDCTQHLVGSNTGGQGFVVDVKMVVNRIRQHFRERS